MRSMVEGARGNRFGSRRAPSVSAAPLEQFILSTAASGVEGRRHLPVPERTT